MSTAGRPAVSVADHRRPQGYREQGLVLRPPGSSQIHAGKRIAGDVMDELHAAPGDGPALEPRLAQGVRDRRHHQHAHHRGLRRALQERVIRRLYRHRSARGRLCTDFEIRSPLGPSIEPIRGDCGSKYLSGKYEINNDVERKNLQANGLSYGACAPDSRKMCNEIGWLLKSGPAQRIEVQHFTVTCCARGKANEKAPYLHGNAGIAEALSAPTICLLRLRFSKQPVG